MRFLLPSLILCLLGLASCSDPSATTGIQANAVGSAVSNRAGTNQMAPLILDHDFGTVPHGETRTHEFDLDLSKLGDPHVPIRVHLECSCGKAAIRMRKPDGTERSIDGSGYARNLPQDDEKVILRITLDTRKKEAVDLAKTVSRGYVLLQPLDDRTGMARQRWAFVVRFGIDAPVVLSPFAAFDFGAVAESMKGHRMTTLRGDDAHPNVEFLSVSTTDAAIEAVLEKAEDHTVVRATCIPGQRGNHRALVMIKTNIPDYTVAMDVVWKVVPDLEASPIDKLTITAALDRAQDGSVLAQQSVLITDHNRRRNPEFVLRNIVGVDGRDVTSLFEVKLGPVPNKERQQRMQVRYLGGLVEEGADPTGAENIFRGKIVLAKFADRGALTGPTLPIALVVFPAKKL